MEIGYTNSKGKQAGSGEIRGDEVEIDIKKRQYTKQ
jgi:hypothetical protein